MQKEVKGLPPKGTKIYNHTPAWRSYTSISLALLTLALVLINYSELKTGKIAFYYGETFSLLFGVWVNGSFYHFFRKFTQRDTKITHNSI